MIKKREVGEQGFNEKVVKMGRLVRKGVSRLLV